MTAPSECSHSLPSVGSKCQCVLIKCLIGSKLIDASADVILGRAPANPASMSSFPARPGRTTIFPPAPMRTLTLPRSLYTLTVAAPAVIANAEPICGHLRGIVRTQARKCFLRSALRRKEQTDGMPSKLHYRFKNADISKKQPLPENQRHDSWILGIRT